MVINPWTSSAWFGNGGAISGFIYRRSENKRVSSIFDYDPNFEQKRYLIYTVSNYKYLSLICQWPWLPKQFGNIRSNLRPLDQYLRFGCFHWTFS